MEFHGAIIADASSGRLLCLMEDFHRYLTGRLQDLGTCLYMHQDDCPYHLQNHQVHFPLNSNVQRKLKSTTVSFANGVYS